MVSCTYENQISEETEETPSLVKLHNEDKGRSITAISNAVNSKVRQESYYSI